MTLDELDALSKATKARLARGPAQPGEDLPYYGYVQIDALDCPPFVMFTNNDSPVVGKYLATGTFEPQSMKLWTRLCRGATGILDIGANVGIYSLCAAKLRPDLAIHAFEPNPYAYARLRMHKTLNKLANIVEHPVAIAPKDGYLGFGWKAKAPGNISSGGGFGHYLAENTEKIMVRGVNLDGTGIAQTLGHRPLVKIDVEGAEAIVISAMHSVIALKPDFILETFQAEACKHINDVLLPLGYRVYRIRETARTLEACDRLTPASQKDPNADFNHVLTTRSASEFETLVS